MKIISELYKGDRVGHVWIVDANDVPLTQRYRARGEADNTGAAQHGNQQEDPTRLYGDHPSGTYRVTDIVTAKLGDTNRLEHYGPETIHLDPISGEALKAKQNGRTFLAIHGGKLMPDGTLRATYGCLRVDDDTSAIFAALIEPCLARKEEVLYECRDLS